MSEIMLHGVLNMPPELWNDASPIDVMQRHARYVQASKYIDELETELAAVTKERDRLAEACKLLMATVGEPNSSADHCWVSEDDNF